VIARLPATGKRIDRLGHCSIIGRSNREGPMKRLVLPLSLLLLAGCAHSQGPSGQGAQPPAAQTMPQTAPAPAPMAMAHVGFIGDDPIKERSFNDLDDRTVEKLTLKNGAIIYYVKLKEGGYPGNFTDADALRVDMADPFYKDRDIRFDRAKVRITGPFIYLLQSSGAFNCFMFHHNFGTGGPRGDQQMLGTVCYPVTGKTAASLKREMVELLGRMRVDGDPIPAHVALSK
jgi:hypothetical protein